MGRFRKGTTGNPGGRPKSMVAAILESRPDVSADLAAFLPLVAFGSPTAVKKRLGVIPSVRDRLAAAAELADRLHGRPIAAPDIGDERPTVPVFLLPPNSRVKMK